MISFNELKKAWDAYNKCPCPVNKVQYHLIRERERLWQEYCSVRNKFLKENTFITESYVFKKIKRVANTCTMDSGFH